MKPNLLKKLSGRMRKRSSSDCSTRKCSLDDSCDPVSTSTAQEGGCLHDSISSRRTVDEMQPVPERAHVARDSSASSLLIAANVQVPAVHHLPSVDVSQPEPIHQYQNPSNQHSTTLHTNLSNHQFNPQENTAYHPIYNFNGRVVPNNSSTATVPTSAPSVPPPCSVIPAPEEDPSILQARKEAIEATAKLMGATHPDTLLAIQSMQKHCRNGREAAASFSSSCG